MWSRRVVETWFGILAVIALAVLMAAALHIPKPVLDSGALGPALFPLGLLVLMIVIQAVLMVQRVLARIGHVPASFIRVGLQQRRLGLGVVASIAYLGLMPWAGYVLTTACFVFAMLFIFRPQSARPIPIWGMAAYAAVIGLSTARWGSPVSAR